MFGCCSRTCSKKLAAGLSLVYPRQTHSSPSIVQKKKEMPWSSGFASCLVHSTSFTLPTQGVHVITVWSSALWGPETGLWFGHDVNLKGQLILVVALVASFRGLCAIVLLANNFLHLSLNSVHWSWETRPHSPLLFFCASSRQLVSNIYLLPFQLDKDNREA